MKTGRVRSKQEAPAGEPAPEATPQEPTLVTPAPSSAAETAPAAGRAPGNRMVWVFLGVGAVIACIVLVLVLRGCGGPKEWVPASRVTGGWTTAVQVFAPQAQIRDTWQTDCESSQGIVQQASCELRDTGQFGNSPSSTYDEYAFNLYWEETWDKVYQAQGTDFVVTQLGGDERIEDGKRLVSQEQLKKETCQQTAYTVWVDDPQDTSQEQEVYLFECEVWNHVTVFDPLQAQWCQCQVTALVPLGVQRSEGTGLGVEWPQVRLPGGGQTEESFSGKVTFAGGDYTYTVTTTDLQQYQEYLSGQYYIAVRNGRPTGVTTTPSR